MRHDIDQVGLAAVGRPSQGGRRDLFAALIRRRWIALGIALPIILVAVIGTLRSSDVVSASARVMIEAKQPENPTFGYVSVDYTVLMSTAAQVALSIPVADKAAAALVDSLPALVAADPALARVDTPAKLRDVLLGGVDAAQVGESNILSIAFRHTDPRLCLAAVGALTEAYIDYSIESQQNTRAIGYYTDQINGVQAELDTLMSRRARILGAAGYSVLQSDAASGVSQIMVLEQEYFKTRAKREAVQTRFEELQAAIADDPDYVPGLRGGENLNLVGLKSKLDQRRADLAELRVRYQDDSEWVQRQLALIEAARVDLHLERNNYVHDLRIELDELRSTERSLAEAVSSQKAGLVGYPDVDRQVSSLDLQIDTQRQLLETLQTKRGEVRLKVGSDARISSIIPLNRPSLETSTAGSKKALYLALASLFALVLGFMGALFAENQDHRLYDRRRAEQYLEVPVLGAISKGGSGGNLP
jgi:uncharacterized protein involved in exopolysaccharide biosynthesis